MRACFCILLLSSLIVPAYSDSIQNKLAYRIPTIEFSEASLSDAVEFLRMRSQELDPAKSGFNIILQQPSAETPDISLSLKNVSIGVALGLVAEMAGLEVSMDSFAVTLKPLPADAVRSMSANQPSISFQQKLASIQFASVEFSEVTLDEALEYIRTRSAELDMTSQDGAKGINLVAMPRPAGLDTPPITLKMRAVPLGDLLRYTCSMVQYEPRVVGDIIKLYPPNWGKTISPAEGP